ncbi:unnamed protein product [Symbiodinium sp. CCMP2456]|nr:unnamed protein product [Symbiodinium sp. CCMP2456]
MRRTAEQTSVPAWAALAFSSSPGVRRATIASAFAHSAGIVMQCSRLPMLLTVMPC